VPQHIKDKVVELFLSGQSVNHIVFLLNYEYRIDAVSEALRERMRFLQSLTTDVKPRNMEATKA
jgi:hypothetical protein